MATIRIGMSVDPYSMGDGWDDQTEAAEEFAVFLRERVADLFKDLNHEVDVDVAVAPGHSGPGVAAECLDWADEYDLIRLVEGRLEGFQNKCWEEFCG